MEKVTVNVSYEGGGYGASIDILSGCIAVAGSFKELRTLLEEGCAIHLQSMREDGDPIPAAFKGEYKLVYKLDAQALLATYDGVFTKSALSRMSGINEKQLWHYAMGVRRPRPAQREKITHALHGLGEELLNVEL
jgi:predicted RNase H-like HicB family nuclease